MPSDLMPKKFSVTVPEPIYEALGILAKIRDKTTATLAAELIESVAQAAIDDGTIAEFKALQASAGDDKTEAFKILEAFLSKLSNGRMPTKKELSAVARQTSISVKTLSEMCDRVLEVEE